jgi:hypothetical protein
MRKKTSFRSKETVPSTTDDVLVRLGQFYAIHNSRVRTLFGWMPVLLVLLVLVDWLIGTGSFSRDTFRMTTVLTIAFILFVTQILFDRLPKVLEIIWRRDLIEAQPGQQDKNYFLEYLNQFQIALDGKGAWIPGLICAAGGLFVTYPFQYFMKAGTFPYNFAGMLNYYFGSRISIIAPVLGFVVGLLVWRVCVIANFIGKIGDRFELKVQPNHPDQCGGFKPIGDLAFTIAGLILIPSIYLAVWGFITTFFKDPSYQIYITLWGGLFRQLLVLLGVLSLFAFIQPLYKIHMRMDANARKVQGELDDLSRKIEDLSFELRSQAFALTPQQGEEKLRTIEFMKKVYEENSFVPTWPFNWKTIIRYASAQAVPLLSLLGTSGPIVEVIKKLIVPAP